MLVQELVHAHRELVRAFPGQILRWLDQPLAALHQLGQPILPPVVKDHLLLLHEATLLPKHHLSRAPLHALCFLGPRVRHLSGAEGDAASDLLAPVVRAVAALHVLLHATVAVVVVVLAARRPDNCFDGHHCFLLDGCFDLDDFLGGEPETLAHLNDLLCRAVHFSEGTGRDLLGPQEI